jgi:hypothetical protein
LTEIKYILPAHPSRSCQLKEIDVLITALLVLAANEEELVLIFTFSQHLFNIQQYFHVSIFKTFFKI